MFQIISIFYIVFLGTMIRNLERSRWDLVLAFFTASFCFYFVLALLSKKETNNKIFYFGILLRASVIFSLPVFSDDFYRFLWDGYLVTQSQSPFSLTPNMWIELHPDAENHIKNLYEHLNSKDYFSVYPMILQAFFLIPWSLGIQNILFQVLCLQLLLLVIDVFCLYFFKINKIRSDVFWLYAGNPILIIESVSQIHVEVILLFILFILLSQTLSKNKKWIYLLYGVILQIKINLIFLFPAFFLRKKIKEKLPVVIFTSLSILVLYLTVFLHFQLQLSKGIGLFFHSFRFNSLFENYVYLLLLPFPDLIYLSGSISLVIGAVVYLGILMKYGLLVEVKVLLGLFIFLIVSPVIHSWYIIPFVGLSIYYQYHIPLSILLTAFSATSYLFYGITNPMFTILVGLIETIIVGVYIWKKKPSSFLQKIPSSEK